MLSTTSDSTPTLLCLQVGEEDLSPSCSAIFRTDDPSSHYRPSTARKASAVPCSCWLVGHLTANRERWHRAMVHDELGVVEDTRINPWLEGVQVGISFVVGGLIPTLPVFFSLLQARWWAYGLTALTALRAGLEFLVVVTPGTLAGVGLGLLLHGA